MKKYKKEREALKLELKELLETEDINWREKMIKDYFYWAKEHTAGLIDCLYKLQIPIFPYDDDRYYYGDAVESFIEKVVPAPEGWEWYGPTVEKK
jgi:hypothetical protein